MAKIVNGSLVLDPNDHIEFVDNLGSSHTVYWDDLLDRFLFEGDVGADQFVGTVNSVTSATNPQPSDDTYLVPTLWINTTTNVTFILVATSPGNAVWQSMDTEGTRIFVNDGDIPTLDPRTFDLWITIDPIDEVLPPLVFLPENGLIFSSY
ncbi:MAG: hypothetical protein KAS32_14880, partial [Candidatus Peribacteraceae bacterium]|nr:hypothetical protein [Candidatus Peribacteraceae bacterium]